ncbi:MAG TPA: hypothetical protein VGE36_00535 [Roseateles sp.]
MAQTRLTYANGAPVQDGDWVRIGHGTALGRIAEVIDSAEVAKSRGLQSLGVVVDAQPEGLVFLSEQLLRDEPLEFVRRGPGEKARFHLAVALGAGALLLLPALYSFFDALYSAFFTGKVTVISLGYNHTHRESVPWHVGWARFVGPPLLTVALCMFDGSRGSTLRWWLSGVMAAVSLALMAFSAWFITISGTVTWLALVGTIALAAVIDRKLGCAATVLFLLTAIVALVWWKFGNTS